ncbi:MogA/MoaB family molybdenum cofactor biosynthesis protein [Hutsoniella sourekii]|uniref:MogA/MoaB family molybdenum cofactor biosynthesis protein n=1 Tax=Hutsoniella sourekii TaxID=87650 RepID=UPI000489BF98|nr:MogA/MoaB family molybdenum cofactor biosynthesis protein [Hutsoniella sourekii]
MYQVAILTISDRSSSGQREDLSGPEIESIMTQAGYAIWDKQLVADDLDQIASQLTRWSDQGEVALILTTGGTGFSPRDVTPEATQKVLHKETPGISEYLRQESSQYTKRAYLSRARSGIRNQCLIVNLPGSPKAIRENLEALLVILDHALATLRGPVADSSHQG